MTISATRISLGGSPVDLREFDEAVDYISERVAERNRPPLAVASINLDHIHHFGSGSRWSETLEASPAVDPAGRRQIEWLNLVDGAPLASQARRLTGRAWPRLAGSDLIGPLVARAERDGTSIGFLGGTESTHAQLRALLTREHPNLRVSGFWAPTRQDLGDPELSNALAQEVAEADTDVLVVALGKPRQELWIAEHGLSTGARVLLAFGAVVDFLAGRISRAPSLVARYGMEWAWRLALEPGRLASRYLVEDPPAYLAVRRTREDEAMPAPSRPRHAAPSPLGSPGARFLGPDGHADVAVIVVTYNSAAHVASLLSSLRAECATVRLRVIVADNCSTDATRSLLADEADLIRVETGGNLGYAGGVNAARGHVGDADTVLVLNPDLSVQRGAIRSMLDRMIRSDAGVVVPRLLESDGTTYHSLRREPTLGRALGDAVFGRDKNRRPAWLSEFDFDQESYLHAHRVAWATGAAILVRRDVLDAVGDWDERFFLYSEETDFFRRARTIGAAVWYEPEARMRHDQGGSGSSPQLDALMAVNRVRYVQKHRSGAYVSAFHATVALDQLLRSSDAVHRATLRVVLDRSTWPRLPRATRRARPVRPTDRPAGAIIIPAHNEEAVIERTLRGLSHLAATHQAEIIVVCNGCSDSTADIARGFPGVRVVEIDERSKPAALNAGDAAAGIWPRLYLDADVEIHPDTVHCVFEELTSGPLLAARPAFRYDTAGASPIVRAYYRARDRMPSTHGSLWGAGAYAVSAAGHDRFGAFPPLSGEDLFVDSVFAAGEKRVLASIPVRVRTPRSVRRLVAMLERHRRGTLKAQTPSTTRSSLREVVSTIHGPVSACDAAVYTALALASRLAVGRAHAVGWVREDSGR